MLTLNNKAALLERLAQGNIMNGWGAILAFDQAQINDLLEQQYLSAFNDLSFLTPISESFSTDDSGEERVTLDGLVFGVPHLSFEQASLSNANATLTLNLIAGTSTTMLHLPGRPPQLLRVQSLRESMGYHLKMTVDLNVRSSQVGDRGMLLLDLTRSKGFASNLGMVPEVAIRIGELLGAKINAHPAYRQLFTAAMLDLSDYGPLSPTSFAVRTQPHPAANDVLSAQHGKGAVVMFCQLRMNERPGGLPGSGADFPYLIPDDVTAQGAAAFNATLLVDARLQGFIRNQQPDIVGQLKLPNAHGLQLSEHHQPLDWVSFGRVMPSAKTLNVEPRRAEVVAGRTQSFTLSNPAAPAAALGSWDAASLYLPSAAGTISADGAYRALPPERFRSPQQVTVVSHGEGAQTRTALLVEVAQAIDVSPRVSSAAGGVKIDLYSNSGVTWELLPDEANGGKIYGKLDDQGGGYAIFTADQPAEEVPEILLQRIRASNASDGTSGEAVIFIIAYTADVEVQPAYVPSVDAGVPLQFNLAKEDDRVSWSVFGEGQIDGTGLFTPPREASTIASVIMADINGRSSGYALVELADKAVAPPDWTDLTAFSVVTRGTDRCYANGMQQIEVLVTIETNNDDVPLTPVELSSLKFYNVIGNSVLPVIEIDQEGLDPTVGAPVPWAVNNVRNRFDQRSALAGERAEVRSEFSTSRRLFYLQSAKAGQGEFYVKFTKSDGREFSSQSKQFTVKVSSDAPPVRAASNYKLDRKRVFNGRGEKIKDDEFSYYLESIDYWTLTYEHQLMPVKFKTCKIEGASSSVRWESEQFEETFFSYLGVAFNPVSGEEAVAPSRLALDGYLLALAKEQKFTLKEDFISGQAPDPGDLLISLHRVDNMPYWHDSMAKGDDTKAYRNHLDAPLKFELRDINGNLHRVQISFLPPSVDDNRNTLQLAVY
ncbi:hypothetical protein [Pseudomonas sp. BP8]|uniref:hypothetical protein n=1 Tax=Pseudomonas sp. BP8 TaxID=2817864 RepID=UPI001AE71CA8|nr:hypothetical protein [Pseudomonas sp. BP8]MBP2263580.1 hypothetical protein [Pseudomonas sp. BP8]HDS1735571.1 hypothetical protein [Pseudomonas putida]